MTDLLTRIAEQPREVLDTVASSMNVRASESAMQAICARYMTQIALPEGARALEVGCGNGAVTKLIMRHLGPARLVGIDPSPVFIDMARETFAAEPRVSFAYIMRRLPALATAAGFSVQSVEPHGYMQTTRPDYLLTLPSSGAHAAARAGEIGQELADGVEREARRRVANNTFYGAILFLSLVARKETKV
jgi:trans-aconitate methyltransferase